MPLLEAGQLVDARRSSSTSTAISGIRPDHRARPAAASSRAVDVQLVVVEAVLARPTGRCRRACSSRRRWRRSARRTSTPCPRRPGRRWPAPAPSPASSRSRTPSRRCRRPAPGGRRSGSGCERSKTPMLSRPRKPPANRLLPVGVLAVHPPGEVEQQLLEDAREEQRGRAGRCGAGRSCRRASTAQACTGGFTSPKANSYAGIWPFGCMYHSRRSSSELLLGEVRDRSRANGIMWNARSQAANQGYSHLSGIEMTSRL